MSLSVLTYLCDIQCFLCSVLNKYSNLKEEEVTEEVKKQLLQIDPKYELVFHGPFTNDSLSVAYIDLTNPTENTIAFKIKTNAPEQYFSFSNSETLKPKEAIIITVGLQHINGIPTGASLHKFLVQSRVVVWYEHLFWQPYFPTPTDFDSAKLYVTFDHKP